MLGRLTRDIADRRVARSLELSTWDGMAWAVYWGLAENFLAPLVLALGASPAQVAWIAAAYAWAIGLANPLGAVLIEHFRRRKIMAMCTVCGHAAATALVFLVAWRTGSPSLAILIFAAGAFCTFLGNPGWTSWQNDLIPPAIRGAYWGMRNRIIGMVQLGGMVVAGVSLHYAKTAGREMLAFGVLFGVAALARLSCVWFVAGQYEPPMAPPTAAGREFRFLTFVGKLFTTNFGRFALFVILITFSVNVMNPLVAVYLLQSLEFGYIQFTAIVMAPFITSIIFMTYWGALGDRYGNHRLIIVTALGIPVIILGWILLKNFYLLVLLQVFAGFVWAGFNLATFNFIFDVVRRENVHKIMAYYQTLNNLCTIAGALAGGWLITRVTGLELPFLAPGNYEVVFLAALGLVVLVIAGFARSFKEVRTVEDAPSLDYFYLYRPMAHLMDQFELMGFKRSADPDDR
ncbi:MAG: MFS transporter [Planctomycetota bacterium]